MRPSRAPLAVLAAIGLWGLIAHPAPVRADPSPYLEQAEAALGELRFDEARQALEKALISGKCDPLALASVYRLLGQVHAALGKPAQAQEFYRQLLALDPDARLPDDISPKLAAPFGAARKAMRDRGALAVECDMAGDRPAVIVRVASDPLEQVAGAQALYRDDADSPVHRAETGGTSPFTVALPTRDELVVVCAAVDQYGNHLARVGSWDRPLRWKSPAPAESQSQSRPPSSFAAAPPHRDEPEAGRPIYARWYLWGTATVLAAGATGYFALATRRDREQLDQLNASSGDHDFTEARDLARRGERHALYTNIALGVAAGFGILTVATLLLGQDDGPPADAQGVPTTRVGPAVFDRGAGVWVRTDF